MNVKVPLIKGDKISVETDYRDALPVNMYGVERDLMEMPGYMLCYPGLTQHTTGEGIDRGGHYNDRFATPARVSGNSLISIAPSGTTTTLGTIPGASQAAMPNSFLTQCVVADGNMYLYGYGATGSFDGFREVTDTLGNGPIDATWINGYYFLTDGENLYHTDLNDEDSMSGGAYSDATFSPDKIKGVAKTQDNKVIVFGRSSIEYFADAALASFAFTRVENRAQKIGIVATHAKCEVKGNFYITGGRINEALGVHVITLGNSEKISTREVDKILSNYSETELSDMRMETLTDDGTTFVLVHLPNETLCFNETVALKFGLAAGWSMLKTDVAGDATYRAINGIFDSRINKWIYGDKRDSTIGYLDNTVFTHYGDMVEWLLYSPFLKLSNMSVDMIELETIPGHNVTDDAEVFISTTKNGLSYGLEWSEMYGEPLDYGKRFVVRRVTGNISDYVGFKLRGATTSRMSFGSLDITYG